MIKVFLQLSLLLAASATAGEGLVVADENLLFEFNSCSNPLDVSIDCDTEDLAESLVSFVPLLAWQPAYIEELVDQPFGAVSSLYPIRAPPVSR